MFHASPNKEVCLSIKAYCHTVCFDRLTSHDPKGGINKTSDLCQCSVSDLWQCVAAMKKGKKFCPDSKGIPEQAIEEAFLESYRLLCDDNKDILDEFLQRMDDILSSSTVNKQLSKLDKEIESIERKKSKLVDMRLEDTIDKVSLVEIVLNTLAGLRENA